MDWSHPMPGRTMASATALRYLGSHNTIPELFEGHGSNANSATDELVGEWNTAIANWSAAVTFADRYAKIRAVASLRRLAQVRASIYRGFAQRGLLLRGFHRFVRCVERQRAYKLRVLMLKKWALSCWRSYLREVELATQAISSEPSGHGLQVYACFKWISIVFASAVGQPSYPPFVSNNHSSSEQGSVMAIGQLRRFRAYVQGHISLPAMNGALMVHATALLDAFQLKRIFRAWQARTQAVVAFTRRGRGKQLHLAINRWASWTIRQQTLSVAGQLISTRHRTQRLVTAARAWRVAFALFVHVRQRLVPRQAASIINALQAARWRSHFSNLQRRLAVRHILRVALGRWQQRKHFVRAILRRQWHRADLSHDRRQLVVAWASWRSRRQALRSDCTGYLLRAEETIFCHQLHCHRALRKMRTVSIERSQLRQRFLLLRSRIRRRQLQTLWFQWQQELHRLRHVLRAANRVVGTTFTRLKNRAFSAWRQLAMQSMAARTERQLALAIATGFARLFVDAVTHAMHRSLKLRTLRQWRHIAAFETIAICVQRRWRGHWVRQFDPRAADVAVIQSGLGRAMRFHRKIFRRQSFQCLLRAVKIASQIEARECLVWQAQRLFERWRGITWLRKRSMVRCVRQQWLRRGLIYHYRRNIKSALWKLKRYHLRCVRRRLVIKRLERKRLMKVVKLWFKRSVVVVKIRQKTRHHHRRVLFQVFFLAIMGRFQRRYQHKIELSKLSSNWKARRRREVLVALLRHAMRRQRLRHVSAQHIGARELARTPLRQRALLLEEQKRRTAVVVLSATGGQQATETLHTVQTLAALSAPFGNPRRQQGTRYKRQSWVEAKTPYEVLSMRWMLTLWLTWTRQRGKRRRRVLHQDHIKWKLICRMYLRRLCRSVFLRRKRYLVASSYLKAQRRGLLRQVLRVWRFCAYLRSLRYMRTVLLVRRLQRSYAAAFRVLRLLAVRQRSSPGHGGYAVRRLRGFVALRALRYWRWLAAWRHSHRALVRKTASWYNGHSKRRCVYWLWRHAVAHRKMKRIVRRVALKPCWSHWLRTTLDRLFHRRFIAQFQIRVQSRQLRELVRAWRILTRKELQLKSTSQVLQEQVSLQVVHKALVSWQLARKQARYERLAEQVHRRHLRLTKRRIMRRWRTWLVVCQTRAQQSLRTVFESWATYTSWKHCKKSAIVVGEHARRRRLQLVGLKQLYARYYSRSVGVHKRAVGRASFRCRCLKAALALWRTRAQRRQEHLGACARVLNQHRSTQIDRLAGDGERYRILSQMKPAMRGTKVNRISRMQAMSANKRGSTESDDGGRLTAADLFASPVPLARLTITSNNAQSLYSSRTINKNSVMSMIMSTKVRDNVPSQLGRDVGKDVHVYIQLVKAFRKLRHMVIVESQKRREQTCKQVFTCWRAHVFCVKHSRLAFQGRLSALLQQHLLSTVLNTWRSYIRERKVLRSFSFYQRMVLQSKLLTWWRKRYMERRLMRDTLDRMYLLWMGTTVKDAFRYWRVVVGPARKVGRIQLLKNGLVGWSHAFRAVRYHRRRALRCYWKAWKRSARGLINNIQTLKRNREITLRVIIRIQRMGMDSLSRGFNAWRLAICVMDNGSFGGDPTMTGSHFARAARLALGVGGGGGRGATVAVANLELEPWQEQVRRIRESSLDSRRRLRQERMAILADMEDAAKRNTSPHQKHQQRKPQQGLME